MIRTESLLAGVFILTFVAYSLGFSGPLLFDDHPNITLNTLLKFDGTEFDEWRTAALSSEAGPLRRPVAMASFAIHHVVMGEFSAFQLKLVNTLIHVTMGWLVYLLTLSLLRTLQPALAEESLRWVALLAATIWLLHPLHVSTVLYAVQRMAQLAALFVVLGLLVFARYRQRWALHGAGGGEIAAAGLWLSLLTLTAACSKENGALLPWLILVMEVCVFRGLWAGKINLPLRRTAAGLMIASCAIFLFVLVAPPDSLSSQYAGREFTLEERVLTQSRLLWHYLYWLSIPDITAMGFQHDDIPLSRSLLDPWTTVLAIVGWLAAIVFAVILRHRYPLLLFALLFYLVGHSVESSVWPLEMVYEHRNYLPSIGVCIMIAASVMLPVIRSERIRASLPLLAIPTVLLPLLLIRVDTWSDELRLSGVNARNHPDSSRSNYFYANALLKRYQSSGQTGLSEEEARQALLAARYYFEKMYEKNPRDVAALVMLHSLDSQFVADVPGRTDWLGKLEQLLQTRVLQPSDLNALGALVDCIGAQGCGADQDRIIRMLDDLSERYPNRAEILGWKYAYLSSMGAGSEELEAILQQALATNPGGSGFRYRLIELYAQSHDVGGMYEAARQWLHYDRLRLDLSNLKSLFSTDSAEAEN